MAALVILIAVLLDYVFAEPKRFHPLVGFGFLVSKVESLFNCSRHSSAIQLIMGCIAWFLLVMLPTVCIVWCAFWMSRMADDFLQSWGGGQWSTYFSLAFLFEAAFLYLAIGHASLRQHAMAIMAPLVQGDLSLARKKVAWIVSRDTNELDENNVCKATIESVLENGSDAIFAPIFWFVVGGLPAVIVYRLSNTLDAMWGYKTERFLYFGRCSARMDDVFNYIPSRLVACSYALLGHTQQAFDCWKKQSGLLNSPNAGVVMTAGAGALNVQLGGEASYHGKIIHKPTFGGTMTVVNKDILRALRLVRHTLLLWCGTAIAFSVLIMYVRSLFV
ncbi:adenosylcobinamide-phosphate synthase CbiB [Eionea flava]